MPIRHDIERVNELTVLGVIVNERLSADNHVTANISACLSHCMQCEYCVHKDSQHIYSTPQCIQGNCSVKAAVVQSILVGHLQR